MALTRLALSKANSFIRLLSSEVALALLAFLYLAIYAFQVLANPPENLNLTLDLISFGINAVFVFDFTVRFFRSSNRIKFLFINAIELASLLLPFVRSLRIFRVLVAASAIQNHMASRQARASLSLTLSIPLVVLVSSLAILDVERDAPGATITNFPLAAWWSIATMATVGDSDLSPVTWEGRIVASALMLLGIGLFGAVAALFAATFINQPNRDKSM